MDEKKLSKVLVIEDEALLLKVISKKFETIGVETVSCVSSTQAVDYLTSLSEINDFPDVIWLDYYLKDSDALDFMQKLKEHPEIPDIPIVVVSNSASEEKVKSLLALGADKYLLKSENKLEDLVKQIKQIINSKEI